MLLVYIPCTYICCDYILDSKCLYTVCTNAACLYTMKICCDYILDSKCPTNAADVLFYGRPLALFLSISSVFHHDHTHNTVICIGGSVVDFLPPTGGPAVYSCNTVTANRIEAFQTADQRAEMMSQPIRFLMYLFVSWVRRPAVYSCNTVTANRIEAFQTADQRAEMMSQPIRFFYVFICIVGSNPTHTGLKPLFHTALYFL